MELQPPAVQVAGRGSQLATSSPASLAPPTGDGQRQQGEKSPHAKEYGSGFSSGFLAFLDSGDLSDVVIEVAQDSAHASWPGVASFEAATDDSEAPAPPGGILGEYRLHSLILARHSAFFAAALGQEHFADSAARRIRLTLDPAAAPTWPSLVRYFYSDRILLDDSNALPLLALARQLLVSELDGFCMDFVRGRLCAANCLAHLRAAVRFALHDLHGECTALAAQGFPVLYGSAELGGLPPGSLLEVLTHPLLQVHCELQVVEAVTRYLATTAVDAEAARALCAQIRFPYLDNATITRLAVQPPAALAVLPDASGAAAADAVAAEPTLPAGGGGGSSASASPSKAQGGGGDGGGGGDAGVRRAGSDAVSALKEASAAGSAAGEAGAEGQSAGAVGSEAAPVDEAGVAPLTPAPSGRADGPASSACRDQPAGTSGAAAATGAATGAVAASGADEGAREGTGAASPEAGCLAGAQPSPPIATADAPGSSKAKTDADSSGGGSAMRCGDAADGGSDDGDSDSLLTAASPSPSSVSRSSSAGGAAAAAGGGSSGGRIGGNGTVAGSAGPQSQQQHNHHHQQHHHLHHHVPLIPRDLALEGALARLAAMEFNASLGQASACSSSSGAYSAGGPWGQGGNGLNHPTANGLNHPALYFPGAGAGTGTNAPLAGRQQRQLAIFRLPTAHLPYGPGGGGAGAGGGGGGGGGMLYPQPYQNQFAAVANHQLPQAGQGPAAAAAAAAAAAMGHAQAPHALQTHFHQVHGHHNSNHQPNQPASAAATSSALRTSGGRSDGTDTAAAAAGAGGHQRGLYGYYSSCSAAAAVAAAAAAGAAGAATASGSGGSGGSQDPAAAYLACCLPPPRPSYCSHVVHGLPGGCAWVDVALEACWEQLVPYLTVKVSGCGEGRPHHVLSPDPDCFFETNDSAESLPWIEIQLPHNVHVLHLHRYTFVHGHRRAGYYRARNFKTQIAVRPAAASASGTVGGGGGSGAAAAAGGFGATQGDGAANAAGGGQRPAAAAAAAGSSSGSGSGGNSGGSGCRYFDLTTRMAEQFDVSVLAGSSSIGPWRVMRLQATGAQEDGVHRLCVRGLRMYGVARIDLMRQADGLPVQPHWVVNARVDHGGGGGGGGGGGPGVGGVSGGASSGGAGGMGGPSGGGAGGAEARLHPWGGGWHMP